MIDLRNYELSDEELNNVTGGAPGNQTFEFHDGEMFENDSYIYKINGNQTAESEEDRINVIKYSKSDLKGPSSETTAKVRKLNECIPVTINPFI